VRHKCKKLGTSDVVWNGERLLDCIECGRLHRLIITERILKVPKRVDARLRASPGPNNAEKEGAGWGEDEGERET
jgi:hypothetical protein